MIKDHSQPKPGAVVVESRCKRLYQILVWHITLNILCLKGTDKISTVDYAKEKPSLIQSG